MYTICVSLSLYLSLSLSIYIYICIHIYTYMYIHIEQYIYIYIYVWCYCIIMELCYNIMQHKTAQHNTILGRIRVVPYVAEREVCNPDLLASVQPGQGNSMV